MAFIRAKTRGGRHKPIDYYYIVENRREGKNIVQKVLEYIGTLEDLKAFAMAQYKKASELEKADNHKTKLAFKVYEHGAEMAMYWCAQALGVESIMDDVFPPKTIKGHPRSRVLLLAMIHRAIDPGSKRAFATWSESTSLPYHLRFNSQDMSSATFWEAMDGITTDQVQEVWRRFVKHLSEVLKVDVRDFHLDYSNYYTYIDSRNGRCLLCKRGHNKQKRDDLRQFSLAVLTSADILVPIVWDLYEGNRNDSTEFSDFIKRVKEGLKKLDIPLDEITVTFDGGSNSEENFKSLGVHFVCAHSLAGHKKLYDIGLEKYSEIHLSNGSVRKAYRIDNLEFSGMRGTGILTHSPALERGQRKELEKDLEKAKKLCEVMDQRLGKPRSKIYTDLRKAKKENDAAQREALEYNKALEQELLNWEQEGKPRKGRQKKPKAIPQWDEGKVLRSLISEGVFKNNRYLSEFSWVTLITGPDGSRHVTFGVDEKQKEAYCRKYFGKKLTVTDHSEWTTQEILDEYCSQECIENGIFRVSKDTDHFSVRPQYHWTDDKILVHTYICLSSILIAEALRYVMEEAGIHVTKHVMLDRLMEIHDGWIFREKNKVDRVVEELSGIHQQMWEVVLRFQRGEVWNQA